MGKTVRKKHLIKNRKLRMWLKRIRFILIIISVIFLTSFIKNSIIGKGDQKGPTYAEAANKPAGITQTTPNDDKTVSETDSIQSTPASAIKEDSTRTTDSLKNQLSSYLKNISGHFGVYYLSLETGEEMEINAQEEFTAASTIKIPLNLMLYKKINSGEINPSDTLIYQKEDYEEGTGVLQEEDFGNSYSFRDLSRLSITKSDNVAANMLIRYFTLQGLKDFMRQSGGKIVYDARNTSCPKDMGLYMKLIYNMYNNNEGSSKELIDSLRSTDFNDRIPAQLPPKIKIAHKIGTQTNVVNDVGIIFSEKPYILSVMSRDVDEDSATQAIADISGIVYKFHASGN